MLDPDIELDCPSCRRKFKQRVSRLKEHARIACPACGQVITIKGRGGDETAAALKKIEDAFRKLGK